MFQHFFLFLRPDGLNTANQEQKIFRNTKYKAMSKPAGTKLCLEVFAQTRIEFGRAPVLWRDSFPKPVAAVDSFYPTEFSVFPGTRSQLHKSCSICLLVILHAGIGLINRGIEFSSSTPDVPSSKRQNFTRETGIEAADTGPAAWSVYSRGGSDERLPGVGHADGVDVERLEGVLHQPHEHQCLLRQELLVLQHRRIWRQKQ